jgi:hypothetical protein
MDCPAKMQETTLPPKECFYNDLINEHISDDAYHHAQNVWQHFNMTTMGDYHDLYLKTDVILLADVYENFRNVCLSAYGLDPLHYLTSPALAWDACLKMTGVNLELITDPDMYLMIEKGIRGGISTIPHRFSRANNPYLEDYDPTLPTTYIIYLDANNLYGWAMSQPLPTDCFQFLTEQQMNELDVLSIPDDSDIGYILEVDLEYSVQCHDLHADYPLAPEHLTVTRDMLSPFCTNLANDFNLSADKVKKLIPNLRNKEKYIVHYRNLKQYVELGMNLTQIHRVISFNQRLWLKTYIDINTEKRKAAKDDFEKDFFKLMNNSVFGKTMENIRNRADVTFANSGNQLKKLVAKPAKPAFHACKIFGDFLAAVELLKTNLKLDKPIYVGFSILDLSKTLMYSFHYGYIKTKYGQAKLNFTDTDSLCYTIETVDIYRDMEQDIDLFDTSDYDQNHFLFSNTNKKVLGKFKDETAGKPPREFVGLRSKMYSILLNDQSEKKTGKGIAKHVVKKVLRHVNYRNILEERRQMLSKMQRIQSYNRNLYTVELNKTLHP